MKNTYFITGTDTDVGKTVVTTALLRAAQNLGQSAYALKPIAAGCEQTAEGLRNQDAQLLRQFSTVPLAYEQVNPVALAAAKAPHIAAMEEERKLSVQRLQGFCRGTLMQRADWRFIEGAGGWRVPLNPREQLSDLVIALQVPVIMVVGMRLGCLNHAQLTADAIVQDGLPLAGWVANSCVPEMESLQENLMTLKHFINAPFLGYLPWQAVLDRDTLAAQLDLSLLGKRK